MKRRTVAVGVRGTFVPEAEKKSFSRLAKSFERQKVVRGQVISYRDWSISAERGLTGRRGVSICQ